MRCFGCECLCAWLLLVYVYDILCLGVFDLRLLVVLLKVCVYGVRIGGDVLGVLFRCFIGSSFYGW